MKLKASKDVAEFMVAMDQEVNVKLTNPTPAVKALRARLIAEEAAELTTAIEANDFVGVADGIADLLYVAIGTALAFGIPLEEVWDEVHASNMAKLAHCPLCHGFGCDACHQVGRVALKDASGKVQKPEGWLPPDIQAVLKNR